MSLLFPLYLAGLAALAAPVVLHMIRRTPGGRVPFGSLMFLRASPPRLVRRQRLDQLALLALRALVLALLALAFARPYLESESRVAAEATAGPRVALLVDTSASMRRADLWPRAVQAAERVLAEAPARARFTLASFDRGLDLQVVEEQARQDSDGGRARVRARLAALAPSWAATDLGGALAALADRLAAQASADEAGASAVIVLVSDLQEGADLTALASHEWPAGVELRLAPLAAAGGNAALHPVPREPGREDEDDEGLRVRIASTADCAADRFRLRWTDEAGAPLGEGEPVYCPPGGSRVVRAPARPADGAPERLVLEGDGAPFDNVLVDRVATARQVQVLRFGPERDPDAQDQGFFLEQVFGSAPEGAARVVHAGADAPSGLAVAESPLLVAEVGPAGLPIPAAALLEHARAGGVVLAVLGEPLGARDASGAEELVRALLGAPQVGVAEDEPPRGYALLGEIDFAHPLFAPFADPRYGDFAKIRFWRRRALALPEDAPELRVLARFEDGVPFLVERTLGAGRVLVMTSGWAPADGDLARSTKFAPLMHGMLRLGAELDLALRPFHVGDAVPLALPADVAARVRRPDGAWVELAPGAPAFLDTDLPGHYAVELGQRASGFTVRLDPDESRTVPLEPEPLESLGVPLTPDAAQEERGPGERQEQAHELERRQKLWRWLILAALGGLFLETVWAGLSARRRATGAS